MSDLTRIGDVGGMPPWDAALLADVQRLEAENAQLRALAARLKHRLAECRRRLGNWELRRQAWKRERDELLARLEAK